MVHWTLDQGKSWKCSNFHSDQFLAFPSFFQLSCISIFLSIYSAFQVVAKEKEIKDDLCFASAAMKRRFHCATVVMSSHKILSLVKH